MKFTAHPLAPAVDLPRVGIDQALVGRLRQSFAVFEHVGDQFSSVFYGKLFAAHPVLRRLFPDDMTAQKRKLFATLQWVVTHLEDGQQLRSAIRELGKRHQAYHARPEHYPMVVTMLLETMADLSGGDWDASVEADWRIAFDLITSLMQGNA